MKKHLLASIKTNGDYRTCKARIRYFQLLSYLSLTGNIAFIITIFYLLRRF